MILKKAIPSLLALAMIFSLCTTKIEAKELPQQDTGNECSSCHCTDLGFYILSTNLSCRCSLR